MATITRIVQSMSKPKQKSKKDRLEDDKNSHKITLISDAKEEIKARLPALAMANTVMEKEDEGDDLMAQLEKMEGKYEEEVGNIYNFTKKPSKIAEKRPKVIKIKQFATT